MNDFTKKVKKMEGKLFEDFPKFENSTSKEIMEHTWVKMQEENLHPENYRIEEIPIDGVVNFELAIEERGKNYITVEKSSKTGEFLYSYLKNTPDGGYDSNPVYVDTIKESIDGWNKFK